VPKIYSSRLREPKKRKKPQTIFVCSMADLFGEWVPDEWIKSVFKAAQAAPQHRYIFLTKNPIRYEFYHEKYKNELGHSPLRENNFLFGLTRTGKNLAKGNRFTQFVSLEPLQDEINVDNLRHFEWVIAGAETGNRKDKVEVKREWIEDIAKVCIDRKIPLFMKSSLAKIWGKPLIQQLPWEAADA
jgi:protein gp37